MKQHLKSSGMASVFLIVLICGIAAGLLYLNTSTYAACQLSLPDETVTMIVDVHELESCGTILTFNSYLSATFSSVPSGYSISDGTYDGSCADLNGYILDNPAHGSPVYEVQVLSSLDNPQFQDRPEINWNKINYILNNTSQYNWVDIQAAIWTLVYNDYPDTFPQGCTGIVNQTNVNDIILDADTNGSSFVPVHGDLFAIVIDPQSCTGASTSYQKYCDTPQYPFQILFTTTTCAATYTVTPSAGAHGTIDPSTPQTVNHNETTSFTVTPDAGYHAVMSGTCGGSLVGNTYTTNPITADCTVTASFAIDTHTVTPSAGANGTIDPSTPQTVNHNETTSFTVTADTGYHIDSVTGCSGTLVGTTYTTGPITEDCTVTATFAVDPLTITTTSPLPSGSLEVPYSETLSATGGVSPYSWSISSGNLPDGLNLNGSTGVISGTPTATGIFGFSAKVTDADLTEAFKNLSITIGASGVRILRTPPAYFSTIQEAYNHSMDDDIIQCQAGSLSGDIMLDILNLSVTLKGGYDANFATITGYTTINGTMTISNGTVIVENIIIK